MSRKAKIQPKHYVVESVTGTRYSGVRAHLVSGGLSKPNPDKAARAEGEFWIGAVEGEKGVRFIPYYDEEVDFDLPNDSGIAPGQVFRLDLIPVPVRVEE